MPNMQFNQQMFTQFMQNPMQVLMSKRLNIPQNLANNPEAMVQHLMNTGQMSQDTYNKLDSLRKKMINQ